MGEGLKFYKVLPFPKFSSSRIESIISLTEFMSGLKKYEVNQVKRRKASRRLVAKISLSTAPGSLIMRPSWNRDRDSFTSTSFWCEVEPVIVGEDS